MSNLEYVEYVDLKRYSCNNKKEGNIFDIYTFIFGITTLLLE